MPEARFNFRVGPHAIEDLGSNLYTTFPRVLAEFIANAYDADATRIEISVDFQKIKDMRTLMRRQHREEVAEAAEANAVEPLADQYLPDSIFIEIRDNGFGMKESDLNDRFLWTAKRRRDLPDLVRTKPGRPLMGRKGLGKLAGFGVAHVMEVTTKRATDPHALRVTLDYDEILKTESLEKIPVDGGDVHDEFLPHEHGTVIRLKRLSFDAVKSRESTVARELSEQFEFIDPSDFEIKLNDERVPAPRRQFAFAWPEPNVPKTQLVSHTLETGRGKVTFSYRIRFRKDLKSLPAEKRGVRVYAANRMASSPSLFNADTNMHGFRMTDYMDGVVKADFIDQQPQDYISTDRRSLRWDTPILSPLKKFLSIQIKEACKQYQKVRDLRKRDEVRDDTFTRQTIDGQELSPREKKVVEKLAVDLARISKKGVNDEKYQQLLPDVVKAFGQGNLYDKLSQLATSERPDVKDLLLQVVRLNRLELDRTTSTIRSRLKAIEALRKEVDGPAGVGAPRNEKEIQKIFEEGPWLIDQTYRSYFTADKPFNNTLRKLAEHLKINEPQIPEDVAVTAAREPDLVFLIGDNPLHSVVVIELKASNKLAEDDDILQLREYMKTARSWLQAQNHTNVAVRGELICTPPATNSRVKEQRYFNQLLSEIGPGSDHRVRSYTKVLDDTEKAHEFLIDFADKIATDDQGILDSDAEL